MKKILLCYLPFSLILLHVDCFSGVKCLEPGDVVSIDSAVVKDLMKNDKSGKHRTAHDVFMSVVNHIGFANYGACLGQLNGAVVAKDGKPLTLGNFLIVLSSVDPVQKLNEVAASRGLSGQIEAADRFEIVKFAFGEGLKYLASKGVSFYKQCAGGVEGNSAGLVIPSSMVPDFNSVVARAEAAGGLPLGTKIDELRDLGEKYGKKG
jgi:hypothetical protein